MKILVVAAEKAGLIDKGGVAQYVLGLVSALRRVGHDVRIAIPPYKYLQGLKDKMPIPGVKVFSVGAHSDFEAVSSAGGIYSPANFERWIAFSRAVVDSACSDDWQPDIIHCQDAHACMVPVFLTHLRHQGNQVAASIKTVLTIHNLLEQGKGPFDLFSYTGLPQSWWTTYFEFWDQTNCYKAGLMTADIVTTVSRTYATEICSSDEFGFGLAGVLKSLARPIRGVVNGIDEAVWAMKEPPLRYDGSDSIQGLSSGKVALRKRLFPEWAWPAREPLIAFKGRWDRQKGIELIPAVRALLGKARFIFDTWPDPGAGRNFVDDGKTVSHTVRDKFISVWRDLEALQRDNPFRFS
jgi:starch synthase